MPQKRGRGRGFYYACGVRGHWEASLGSIAEMHNGASSVVCCDVSQELADCLSSDAKLCYVSLRNFFRHYLATLHLFGCFSVFKNRL